MTLVNNYQDDLENGNPAILLAEYKLWQRYLKNLSEEPTNALQALSLFNNDIYPNIYKLLQILATLPVSTSSNERPFSNLNKCISVCYDGARAITGKNSCLIVKLKELMAYIE
jgi:hypothetical protein